MAMLVLVVVDVTVPATSAAAFVNGRQTTLHSAPEVRTAYRAQSCVEVKQLRQCPSSSSSALPLLLHYGQAAWLCNCRHWSDC
jgi:hypothetical protein